MSVIDSPENYKRKKPSSESQNSQTPQDLQSVTSGWFDNKTHSDLLVKLQDEQVLHCHKLMLRSWSDVWAAALEEVEENKRNHDQKLQTLDLTSCDPEIAKLCLQYCYTGNIALTGGNLVKVRRFALCYHLQGLQSLCETAMQEQLTAKNCVSVYSDLADIPSLPAALEAAKGMVRKHFVTVVQDPSFCELSTHALCELLKSDEIHASEDDILKVCCRWIDNNQPTVSLKSQESVMQLVRFSQLSPKALLEFKSHEVMVQSRAVLGYYQLGLEWRMTEHAGADRKELQKAIAERHTQVAFEPRKHHRLEIHSQILDAEMTRQLALMLGRSAKANLLFKLPTTHFPFQPTRPILCVIQDNLGHVFGCYSENIQWNSQWVPANKNDFVFSLKEVGSQQVVKLCVGEWTSMYITQTFLINGFLYAFPCHCTAEGSSFQLAAGFEGRPRTLHGQFGMFEPALMEVFEVEAAPSS